MNMNAFKIDIFKKKALNWQQNAVLKKLHVVM